MFTLLSVFCHIDLYRSLNSFVYLETRTCIFYDVCFFEGFFLWSDVCGVQVGLLSSNCWSIVVEIVSRFYTKRMKKMHCFDDTMHSMVQVWKPTHSMPFCALVCFVFHCHHSLPSKNWGPGGHRVWPYLCHQNLGTWGSWRTPKFWPKDVGGPQLWLPKFKLDGTPPSW